MAFPISPLKTEWDTSYHSVALSVGVCRQAKDNLYLWVHKLLFSLVENNFAEIKTINYKRLIKLYKTRAAAPRIR